MARRRTSALIVAAFAAALGVAQAHDAGAAGTKRGRLVQRHALRAEARRAGRLRPARPFARSRILELPRSLTFEGGDLLPLPQPRLDAARPATRLARGVVIGSVADARRHNIQRGSSAPIFFLGHGFRTDVR